MVLINQVTFLLAVVFSMTLGIWVFLSDRKSQTSKSFFAVALSIILWIVFSFLGGADSSNALIWYRLNFAAVSITFISFYFLADNFPVPSTKKTRSIYPIVAAGCIFSILSALSNKVIKAVTIESTNQLNIQTGILGYFFYAYIGIFALIIMFNFLRKYYTSKREERSRIVLFLVGLILYATFNIIFNFIFPMILNGRFVYYQFGDYSAIFFLGFTAYAILKRGLFNIKIIATETTVVALSIGLLVEVFISNSISEGALKGIVWILATYGGFVLIKSVKNEIRQKDDLQILSKNLKEANEHLKELDETKDNFLSMAAHELNTPISAIEGYLSMIVDEKMCGDLGEQANKYLSNVYNSSKRLAALVKDLLNVSRIESNRIHLIYEETQFEDLVDQCISEIKIKADQEKHELIWNRPVNPMPKTWLDKSRIAEVIINLLGNAVKYTDPGGRIEIEVHTDGNKIVFSIQDNGRGIPKDKQIFEKFVQVDVLKDQVKGTGLGMFISKNLVELHGGKIWYTSSIGPDDHGTRFFFSVPILAEKPADQFEGQGAVLQLK